MAAGICNHVWGLEKLAGWLFWEREVWLDMNIIRENPHWVILAAFAIIVIAVYFCYQNPNCAVCQFLDAFN